MQDGVQGLFAVEAFPTSRLAACIGQWRLLWRKERVPSFRLQRASHAAPTAHLHHDILLEIPPSDSQRLSYPRNHLGSGFAPYNRRLASNEGRAHQASMFQG